MGVSVGIDRLAMRARPDGTPIMHQNWENLLFLHWPMDPVLIRPLIPAHLEIDTFEGQAWISITPFNLTGLRLVSAPPILGLNSFDELNVRTYVHLNGTPGIWFFSLDASKLIPAMVARIFFMLPYFKADIDSGEKEGEFRFSSKRLLQSAAQFHATWRSGVRLRDPDIDSLAFFLVERYGYFAVKDDGSVWLTRIYHHPWILEEATVGLCESTMISALGIPQPEGPPLAHFSRFLNVQIWAPEEVSA
jgi:uncharacterized protein